MTHHDDTNRADGPRNIVRDGGIARSDADIEDVTRDTYGFPPSEEPAGTRDERFAQAHRVAAEAGIPELVDDVPGAAGESENDSGTTNSSASDRAPAREETDNVE
jgi:hypothetical protein